MIQLKGGETFLIPEPGSSLDSHLWIVLSEPSIDPENVLIVNLTTWAEYKDQACLLQPGDHPFVKQRTCVNYADAKVVTAHQLETFLDRGQIKHQTPLTPELLRRVREGAAQSTRMALAHAQVLFDQELIE